MAGRARLARGRRRRLHHGAEPAPPKTPTHGGVLGRIDFQQHDLSDSFPTGDILHGVGAVSGIVTVRLEREAILRKAAAAVAPGGRLVIVDHGAPPPGFQEHGHHHHFAPAEEVVAQLDLDTVAWSGSGSRPSRATALTGKGGLPLGRTT